MRESKIFKIETFIIGKKLENILDKNNEHKENVANKSGSSSECSNQVIIAFNSSKKILFLFVNLNIFFNWNKKSNAT